MHLGLPILNTLIQKELELSHFSALLAVGFWGKKKKKETRANTHTHSLTHRHMQTNKKKSQALTHILGAGCFCQQLCGVPNSSLPTPGAFPLQNSLNALLSL